MLVVGMAVDDRMQKEILLPLDSSPKNTQVAVQIYFTAQH